MGWHMTCVIERIETDGEVFVTAMFPCLVRRSGPQYALRQIANQEPVECGSAETRDFLRLHEALAARGTISLAALITLFERTESHDCEMDAVMQLMKSVIQWEDVATVRMVYGFDQ